MKYILWWPVYAFLGLTVGLICLAAVMLFPRLLDCFDSKLYNNNRFSKWGR